MKAESLIRPRHLSPAKSTAKVLISSFPNLKPLSVTADELNESRKMTHDMFDLAGCRQICYVTTESRGLILDITFASDHQIKSVCFFAKCGFSRMILPWRETRPLHLVVAVSSDSPE